MTNFLIRRLVQMFIVVLISAAAAYALLNLAPGGPLSGLQQIAQNNKFRLTAEDIARIRASFELDLYLPVRFTRWLMGWPRGPLIIGNYEIFGGTPKSIGTPVANAAAAMPLAACPATYSKCAVAPRMMTPRQMMAL